MSTELITWIRAQFDWQTALAQRALQASPDSFVGLVSPRWALRDVDANRRILALHEGDHECSTIRRGVDWEGKPYEEIDNCAWVIDGDCSTVRLLAVRFEDRPGYRDGWRP